MTAIEAVRARAAMAVTTVVRPPAAPVRPPAASVRTAPRPGAAPPPQRPRHRSRRSRVVSERLIAAGVFVVALVVGLWNVTDATAFVDDEGTYAAQALAVTQGDFAPYAYWYDHPPLGWVQLALLGLVPRLFGVGDGSELALLRPVAGFLFAVTVTLVHLLARRLGTPRPFALLAAGLVLASPLMLGLGRQVFLDNVAAPWVLLAFWLVLSPRRAMWSHVGAGAAFGVALLTKLTAAVFGPALLLALLLSGRWRGKSFSIVGFLAAGGLVFATLRSELLAGPGHVSLQEGLEFQFASRDTSGSFWDTTSDRYSLVMGWVQTDPLLFGLGLVGALVCLTARRTRWLPLALATVAVPMLLGTSYLPAMYVLGALPFLGLAAGVGAGLVWRAGVRSVRRLERTRPSSATPGARRLRNVGVAVVVTGAMLGLTAAALPQWRERTAPLLTAQSNVDWRAATAWVEENVPLDDDIAVPYSAWSQVQEQGRGGPWDVIALEKVDLDSQFAVEHPGGWREIEWILEGPTVEPNITNLALGEMAQAMESSRVVATFGQWRVREVVAGPLSQEEQQ